MKEVKQDCKAVMRQIVCPTCENSFMTSTDEVIGTAAGEPRIKHRCNDGECNAEHYFTYRYPWVDFEVIEKS